MANSVELNQIDRRYEACRVRNAAREARLRDDISQRGIQEPLLGTQHNAKFILLDGFKRWRSARRLGIESVPVRAMGEEDAMGIIMLMRAGRSLTLNILEEAHFIEQLIRTHGMTLAEIARQLQRSKAWVSMRRQLLGEIPPSVRRALQQGKFPVYSYLYTLRPFMRMNGTDTVAIERFVQQVAGQSLSLRDIELLADSYFRGPAPLRQAIDDGQWKWSLQQVKETLAQADMVSAFEQSVLQDLQQLMKLVARLVKHCHDARLVHPLFFAEASLLSTGLLAQQATFHQALEMLHARSRHA